MQNDFARRHWFGTDLLLVAVAIYLPLAAAAVYRDVFAMRSTIGHIVVAPDDQLPAWFSHQFGSYYHSRYQSIVALLLTVVFIVAAEALGLPWTGLARILFLGLVGIIGYFAGIVGWYCLGAIILLYRLAQLDVKADLFRWPREALSNLHRRYLNVFYHAVLIYVAAFIGVYLSPGGAWLALHDTTGQLLIFPPAALVISLFIGIQVLVHRLMVRCKERRLQDLEEMLANNLATWVTDPAADRSKVVEVLMRWYESVRKESDWPLNIIAVLTVVATLLLPAIESTIDVIGKLGQ